MSPSAFVSHLPFGLCRLSYDEGEDEESFEWVDFRELTDDEVRQHPSYIVVPPHPPAPSASAAANPAPKAGSSNTEQVSLHCCCLQHCRGFQTAARCIKPVTWFDLRLLKTMHD